MSEQTTPRTVEEAAREEAERCWPMTDQERAMVSFGVQFAQQAARMPSVDADAIAAVLYEADHPTRLDGWAGAPEWKRRAYLVKAERVVALWGAEPGREER